MGNNSAPPKWSKRWIDTARRLTLYIGDGVLIYYFWPGAPLEAHSACRPATLGAERTAALVTTPRCRDRWKRTPRSPCAINGSLSGDAIREAALTTKAASPSFYFSLVEPDSGQDTRTDFPLS